MGCFVRQTRLRLIHAKEHNCPFRGRLVVFMENLALAYPKGQEEGAALLVDHVLPAV